jgi:hypothetical protein
MRKINQNETLRKDYTKIPNFIIDCDIIKPPAKLLYIKLYQLANISNENGWVDDNNKVFVKITHENAAKLLKCTAKTVGKHFKALIKAGYIEVVSQGANKPWIIYPLTPEIMVKAEKSHQVAITKQETEEPQGSSCQVKITPELLYMQPNDEDETTKAKDTQEWIKEKEEITIGDKSSRQTNEAEKELFLNMCCTNNDWTKELEFLKHMKPFPKYTKKLNKRQLKAIKEFTLLLIGTNQTYGLYKKSKLPNKVSNSSNLRSMDSKIKAIPSKRSTCEVCGTHIRFDIAKFSQAEFGGHILCINCWPYKDMIPKTMDQEEKVSNF